MSKVPATRVVVQDDEGLEAFMNNMQAAGRGLTPTESWEDIRHQGPVVIQHAVRAIRTELAAGAHLWDILEVLRQATAPGDLGAFKESLNVQLPAIVEVVALIGLATSSDAGQNEGQPTEGNNRPEVPKILGAAEQIVRLAQLIALSSSSDQHFGRAAELTGLLRTFEVSVRGRNYFSVSRRVVHDIFSSPDIEELVRKNVGFTPEEIAKLWDAIQAVRQETHEAKLNRFEELMGATKSGGELSATAKAEAQVLVDALFLSPGRGLSFRGSDLTKASGLAEEVIEEILNCFSLESIEMGAQEAVEKFVDGENLLAGKGLLRKDGTFFVIGDPLPHDFVRPLLENMLKANGKAWNQYQRRRDGWTESEAGKQLAVLFGVATPTYQSLKYKAPESESASVDLSRNSKEIKKNTVDAEADALFVIDDVAICVEVKAGSITDKARSGNVRRVEKDLEKTIGEASGQAARLERLIQEHRGLWNSAGRWIDLAGVQEVHSVVVCLDDWGPLATATDALVRAGVLIATSIPWLVSLHDLIVIASIMESPGDFLNYLRRRTDPATSRLLTASDELDVVMWYFHGGLYFEPDPFSLYKKYPNTSRPRQADRNRYKESNVPTRLSTHTDPLDAWMYFHEGQTDIAAAKPTRNHIKPLAAVIHELEDRKDPGWLRTCADLSGLSMESEELLGEHIEGVVEMTRNDGGFHTSVQTHLSPRGHVGIFLGSKPPTRDTNECMEKLQHYVRLKKYQLQLDRASAILIDTAGEVVRSEYTNAPHRYDAELEKEVEASGLVTPAQMRQDSYVPSAAKKRKKPAKKRRR